jgi:hypothetical protein
MEPHRVTVGYRHNAFFQGSSVDRAHHARLGLVEDRIITKEKGTEQIGDHGQQHKTANDVEALEQAHRCCSSGKPQQL